MMKLKFGRKLFLILMQIHLISRNLKLIMILGSWNCRNLVQCKLGQNRKNFNFDIVNNRSKHQKLGCKMSIDYLCGLYLVILK